MANEHRGSRQPPDRSHSEELQAADHAHAPNARPGRFLRSLWRTHSHDPAEKLDLALETSDRGIRALKVSLVALGVTALLQATIVSMSGSVALLSDTIHNVTDALTALPLWLAFSVGKRARSRRYTHGYGRAEDLAGVFVVLVIASSAAVACYESIHRLIDPEPVSHLGLVAVASVVGFAGNELVALYRIRIGREIGSAALVADGLHARTDGLTSLAVLAGAIGVALGYPRADAIAGLVITIAILVVLKNAARGIYHRLMDAVSPDVLSAIERSLASVDGIERVDDIRVRWIGHRLRAEIEVTVDAGLTVAEGHSIAVNAHHSLLHDVPMLGSALIHANPSNTAGVDHHAPIAHHLRRSTLR